MTIIVGTTTPDGIVLASDSRLTRSRGDGYRVMSDSAQKLFAIQGFGVATAGIAFIADDTVERIAEQLDWKLAAATGRRR